MAVDPLPPVMTEAATPLERELASLIEMEGPLPLDRFMALCLGHPRHGYYMTRNPLGAAGDFTTAPEITQMFGEIIAIWLMQCFDLMDRPATVDLIELGPGRGTLIVDILRAGRAMPDFLGSLRPRLVEMSPHLRALQESTLHAAGIQATWHGSLDDIPSGPTLLFANEFIDALPVRQFQKLQTGWAERVVVQRNGELALGLMPAAPALPEWTAAAAPGDIAEIRPAADRLGEALGRRLALHPSAAIVIDYGHAPSALGDTLQGVRGHRKVPILDRPGETDLTAHVDFQSLADAIARAGATVLPFMSQGAFLKEMGLELRAGILGAKATDLQKRELAAAMERVAGPREMGQLFKVLAAVSPHLGRPHPFSG
jgi:NADH dehydrogenase [ubiquinone] 1 alpha subcomplex assembly factor 7